MIKTKQAQIPLNLLFQINFIYRAHFLFFSHFLHEIQAQELLSIISLSKLDTKQLYGSNVPYLKAH